MMEQQPHSENIPGYEFDFPQMTDILPRYKKVKSIGEVIKKLQEDAKAHKKIMKNDFYSGKSIHTTPDGYKKYLYIHCRQKNCRAKLIYQITPETNADKVCQKLINVINKNIPSSHENIIRVNRDYILRKFNIHHTHDMEYYKRLIRRRQLFKAEEFVANLTKNCENCFQLKDVKDFMEEHWKIPNTIFYNKYYPLICLSEQIEISLKKLQSQNISCIRLTTIKNTDLFPNLMIITPKMRRKILYFGNCFYFHIKNIEFRSQDKFFHWAQIYIVNEHLLFQSVALILLGQNILALTSQDKNQTIPTTQESSNSKSNSKSKPLVNIYGLKKTQIFTQIFNIFFTQAAKIKKTKTFTLFTKQSQEIIQCLSIINENFKIKHFYLISNHKDSQTQHISKKQLRIFQQAKIFQYPKTFSQMNKQIKRSDQRLCQENLQKMQSFIHQKDFVQFMTDFQKTLEVSQYLRQKFFGKFKKKPQKYFISQLMDQNDNPVFCNNLGLVDIQKHIISRIQKSICVFKEKTLQKYLLRLIRQISMDQRSNKMDPMIWEQNQQCQDCENLKEKKDQPDELIKKETQKNKFISGLLFSRFPQLKTIHKLLCPKIYTLVQAEFLSTKNICNYETKVTKDGQIFYELIYLTQKMTVFKISNSKVQCSCRFSIRYGLPCTHEIYVCLQENYSIQNHIKNSWKKRKETFKNKIRHSQIYDVQEQGDEIFQTKHRYPTRQRLKSTYL